MRVKVTNMKKGLLAITIGAAFTSSVFTWERVVAASPPPVSARNGMVTTTQRLASQVGAQVLQSGGNAVDAAVAVGYALAVVDPCCGNLGGGGFMTIHLANGKNTFINFREKAPLAATPNMFLDSNGNVIPGLSTTSYLAVGVPGTVMGLEYALAKYGTKSRQQLIAPAINLAQQGFILQQGDIDILNTGTSIFAQQPNVAAIFLKNGKTPYQVGDRLVQKDLANTLNLIATQGVQGFYNVIGAQIAQASSANKGLLTKLDFANYTVEELQPVSCNYRGYDVITSPPPGSGTTLCQMLNTLEGYPLGQLGFRSPTSVQRMLETMLFAYADRNTYLGDPDFIKIPILPKLLSKSYAALIRGRIPNSGAIPPCQVYSCVATTKEGTNTTHYSIYDRYGNAVSVTYTINSFFGNGKIAGNTGFFLNNEMDDFATKPGTPNQFGLVQGAANAIAPGKRPLSSMSPTIVLKNGKVFMVTGSPGGSRIITTVLQVITNVIDYKFNIQDAVNAPRFHYQGLPNVINTELGSLPPDTINQLSQTGFSFEGQNRTWGAAQSLLVDSNTGTIYGASDSRYSAGEAVGY